MDMIAVIVILAILFLVFLICREITCWYFKLTEISETLSRIEGRMKNLDERAKEPKKLD